MATSPKSEGNGETELTMCDVLQEEQELEEDANAVLGGSDDTNCSYDEGYVPRQALYACTTCSVGNEPGGICLACCYACHDGHEVVELYTKRNFRCDCGNSKFPNNRCNLKPDKDPNNSGNKYNQNFSGLYCSCSRPYPDLDDSTSDEMIQCIICEDWYHGRHLGGKVPDNDNYLEMVCVKCMESRTFLYFYLNHFNSRAGITNADDIASSSKESNGFKKEVKSSEDNTVINVTDVEPSSDNTEIHLNAKVEEINVRPNGNDEANGKKNVEFNSNKKDIEAVNLGETKDFTEFKQEKKETLDVAKNPSSSKIKLEFEKCNLKRLQTESIRKVKGPAFWPEHWRKELCHCSDCMNLYETTDCIFLLNADDTIQSYEERGKCRSGAESQYDKGLSALGQLDRVKQMEAIRAYTNMKGKLKEYLKEFAENKRTVCESDIKEFFDQMSKRPRLNNDIPHFCR